MFNNKCMVHNCEEIAVIFRFGKQFCIIHDEKDREIIKNIKLLEDKIKNINIKDL